MASEGERSSARGAGKEARSRQYLQQPSNTVQYTLHSTGAAVQCGHATSDARMRTPQRQDACGARDYSAGRGCDGNWHGPHPRPGFALLQPTVLPHALHIRFFRGLASFPRSPCDRLCAGAGRALAEAPTFVCPTIWTSSCALEFSGSAGIGVGSQTATAGAVSFAAANSSVSSSAPGATRSAASRTRWLRSHAL